MTKIIPTDNARQGSNGKPVLLVLIATLLLAAAVWYGVEFYGEMIDQGAQTATQPAG